MTGSGYCTGLSSLSDRWTSDSAKHIKTCQHIYLNFRFVVLKGIWLLYFLLCHLFDDFRTGTHAEKSPRFKFSYNLLL